VVAVSFTLWSSVSSIWNVCKFDGSDDDEATRGACVTHDPISGDSGQSLSFFVCFPYEAATDIRFCSAAHGHTPYLPRRRSPTAATHAAPAFKRGASPKPIALGSMGNAFLI
jgi:hypothetical protein